MIAETIFKQDYEKHLHHLKLKGLQFKTIDAYSRSIRYIGKYFDYEIRNLSEQQLVDYFTAHNADEAINELMKGFAIGWGKVK